MEDLSFFVGVIGNVISVLLFLSPVTTFWRIIKQKSTQEFQSLPYICTLLNSSLWTYYGIAKPGEYLVATVNGFGVVVEAVYVTLFLIYAPSRAIRRNTGVIAGIVDVGFLAAAIIVTRLAFQGEARTNAIGFMGAALNIVMYASPLSAMKTVVTTKSVEYMPFWLSFFSFLNGGTWALYALLVGDILLEVPNATGLLLGVAQLLLYAIYGNAKPSKTNTISDMEEGTRRQPLISSSDQT